MSDRDGVGDGGGGEGGVCDLGGYGGLVGWWWGGVWGGGCGVGCVWGGLGGVVMWLWVGWFGVEIIVMVGKEEGGFSWWWGSGGVLWWGVVVGRGEFWEERIVGEEFWCIIGVWGGNVEDD